MVNEFPVEVLDAPFDLAFVLRVRGIRKMNLDMTAPAPLFPLISGLPSMIA